MKNVLSVVLFSFIALNAAEGDDAAARKARMAAFKAAAKANGTYNPRSEVYRDAYFAAADVVVVKSEPVVLTPQQIKRGNSYMAMRARKFAEAAITNPDEYARVHAAAQEINNRKQQGMFVSRHSSAFLEGALAAFAKYNAQNQQ